jgi:hypothetical protein
VNQRLFDMLMLVSRVQEQRGDIRFLLRQDSAVQQEVHVYLDDITRVSEQALLQLNQAHAAAGKEQLLAMLRSRCRRERRWLPARVLAVTFSVSLLLGLVLGAQAASHSLPAPVEQAIHTYVYPRDSRTPATDLSTPAEAALQAAVPVFTK